MRAHFSQATKTIGPLRIVTVAVFALFSSAIRCHAGTTGPFLLSSKVISIFNEAQSDLSSLETINDALTSAIVDHKDVSYGEIGEINKKYIAKAELISNTKINTAVPPRSRYTTDAQRSITKLTEDYVNQLKVSEANVVDARRRVDSEINLVNALYIVAQHTQELFKDLASIEPLEVMAAPEFVDSQKLPDCVRHYRDSLETFRGRYDIALKNLRRQISSGEDNLQRYGRVLSGVKMVDLDRVDQITKVNAAAELRIKSTNGANALTSAGARMSAPATTYSPSRNSAGGYHAPSIVTSGGSSSVGTSAPTSNDCPAGAQCMQTSAQSK